MTVTIVSYGVLHPDTPTSTPDVVVDVTTALRNPPEDPRVRERMLQLTGTDPEVFDYVMNTPGAGAIVDNAFDEILKLVEDGSVTVHSKCKGGKHRSVAIAEALGRRLQDQGVTVTVSHPHKDRPIIK